LKVTSIFRSGAILCTALLSCFLIFSARSSSAEPLAFQNQQPVKPAEIASALSADLNKGSLGDVAANQISEPAFVAPATLYVATAYSLRGRTASGLPVSKGLIAADPRILPLGSRVKLEAGNYSGEYLVADTGGAVRGRHVDIWTPTSREAMRFGRRAIKLTVLSWGGKRKSTLPKKTR